MTTTLIFALGLVLSFLGFNGMLIEVHTTGWRAFCAYLVMTVLGGSILIAGMIRIVVWLVNL